MERNAGKSEKEYATAVSIQQCRRSYANEQNIAVLYQYLDVRINCSCKIRYSAASKLMKLSILSLISSLYYHTRHSIQLRAFKKLDVELFAFKSICTK